MKLNKIISLFFTICFLISSCEDNRLDGMSRDRIYILNSDLYEIMTEDIGIVNYSLVISKGGYGTESAEMRIVIDNTLIDNYNDFYSTSYKPLPEQYYNFKAMSGRIDPSQNEIYFELEYNTNSILDLQEINTSEYVIPIKLESLNGIEINENKDWVLLAPIIYNESIREPTGRIYHDAYDRSDWEVIEWNSLITMEEELVDSDRTPDKMLDGDILTFCSTKWEIPHPMPYYFIFDMKQVLEVWKVELQVPVSIDWWRHLWSAGYIEVSSDGINWNHLLDFVAVRNGNESWPFEVPTPAKARYIKLWLTESIEYETSTNGELNGARCDISEFIVYGGEYTYD